MYASKRRNTEFHALFKEIEEEELLVEDYICALSEKILLQGKMYISEKHVCFYSNVFGYIRDIVIPFSKISSIERRNIAIIIPNSIEITLNDGSSFFFASLLSREETILLLLRLWRRTEAIEVMNSDNSVVQTEELPPPSEESSPLDQKDTENEEPNVLDRVSSMMESNPEAFVATLNSSEVHGHSKHKHNHKRHHLKHRSQNTHNQSHAPVTLPRDSNILKRDKSHSSLLSDSIRTGKAYIDVVGGKESLQVVEDATQATFDLPESVVCDCKPVKSKEKDWQVVLDRDLTGKYADLTYLWQVVFGRDSSDGGPPGSFEYFLRNIRKYTVVKISRWTMEDRPVEFESLQPGCSRVTEFNMPLESSIGPKSTDGTVFESILHYSKASTCLEQTTLTPNVPYSDCFRTICRFSLIQVDPHTVNISVFCHVKWVKSSIMRSVIGSQLVAAVRKHMGLLGSYLEDVVAGKYYSLNKKAVDSIPIDSVSSSPGNTLINSNPSLDSPISAASEELKSQSMMDRILVVVDGAKPIIGKIISFLIEQIIRRLSSMSSLLELIFRKVCFLSKRPFFESFVIVLVATLFCIWGFVMIMNFLLMSRLRKAVSTMVEVESQFFGI